MANDVQLINPIEGQAQTYLPSQFEIGQRVRLFTYRLETPEEHQRYIEKTKRGSDRERMLFSAWEGMVLNPRSRALVTVHNGFMYKESKTGYRALAVMVDNTKDMFSVIETKPSRFTAVNLRRVRKKRTSLPYEHIFRAFLIEPDRSGLE